MKRLGRCGRSALNALLHQINDERLWHLPARPHPRFWKVTWLTIRIAWWLILIHVIEITIWALVFWWQKCLPDAESSFYFAGVTYTTVGYGDLVLPKEWRLFGPLEGLTGILMCGLSTAFFFAVLSKRFAIWSGGSRTGSHAVQSNTRRGSTPLTDSSLSFREK